MLTLAGTAEANSTVKVYDGATLLGTATANGTGAWSYTTGALSNGAHSLTATATDAAGNTSAASTALSVTVETGVPVVTASLANDTGSSSADGITSNATLTGLADPNALVHFTVDGSAIAQTATADGSGVWSFTPTGLADGAHTIVASQTDVAGNTGTASLSFTLDTTAPVAPTIASFSTDSGTVGDGITNDNTLTLTGTAEANATVKVYDGATLLGTATANGSGAWSYYHRGAEQRHAQPDRHRYRRRRQHGRGLHGAERDGGHGGAGRPDHRLVLQRQRRGRRRHHQRQHADADRHGRGQRTVKVYDGATLLGTATANGTGAWSYTTSALANGAHSLTATATDAAGNTGAASTALSVTVDTAAPVAPTIASFSTDSGVVGDHITNDNTLTLTGTAEANATVKVYDGATLLGTATANGTGAWSYTTAALSNGTHSLTATATDAAGNTGAASTAMSVTVDTAAPVAPTIASFSNDSGTVGDGITNDNTLTLTGTAEANSTVKVYDGATLLGTATANGTGAWSYTTAALANGTHSLTATATDAAGNTGAASTALSVTVDTVAPVAPTITSFTPDSGTVGDGITNASVLTLTGTAEANSTVKVYDGATLLGTATANGTGAWSYTTGTLNNGVHSLTATATDAAGNTGAASTAMSVTIETGVPVVTASLANDTGSSSADAITSNATLTGLADPNAVVHFTVDGSAIAQTATADGSGVWSFTPTGLADGAHTIVASQTDVAGNTGTASLSFTLDTSAPTAPTIASFSNDSGMVGDGITNDNTLTLTGTAEANSPSRSMTGQPCSAPPLPTAAASGATYHRCPERWRPQSDRHRYRRRRQHRRGLHGDERDGGHGGAGRPDHRLVLQRQRHGR